MPAGASLGVPGIQPWRTPNKDFYLIHTALAPPSISPPDWQLRIHGMVERELTFSYQDLVDRQLTEAWVTLCCVSNEVGGDLIGNAWWSGVLARELLAEAGVKPGADAVLQTSRDGWNCGTPLAALTDDRNAMLAVAMNGQPLPVEHGFPVRMVVPGLYGYVSATKWLVDLEVTRFDKFEAYWTERGWSEKGPVKTQSRIDVPRRRCAGQGGFAAHRRQRVGPAHRASRRWSTSSTAPTGRRPSSGACPTRTPGCSGPPPSTSSPASTDVVVRATDRSGYTQTSVQTDVVPDGATGWDSIPFDAS